ncbi:IS630 family transposase [Ignatzschineria indica]|nr:IS630 family transposase [Ignatzschineria indica]
MPKKTPRNHKLTDHDFLQLSKTEGNARARIRLLMLHQLSQGHPIATVAENFGYNPRSVYTIRRKYWLHGITSVYDAAGRGRKSLLAEQDIEPFKQAIVEAQQQRGGGRLTAKDIAQIAKEQFNANYTPKAIYPLMKRIGMSWISARSQHPKADPKVMEAYKKNFLEQVKQVLPDGVDIKQVDIWFQDETRIGQQGSITRVWHYKGQRPRVVRQQ